MTTSAKAATESTIEDVDVVNDVDPDVELAKLAPLDEPRDWILPEYGPVTQRPLSFFGKNEFFALIAKAIETTLSSGVSFDELASSLDKVSGDARDKLKSGDLAEVRSLAGIEDIARLIAKLFQATPDLLLDAYLVFLAVPRADRGRCRDALTQIDDDTGFGILETFVSQNNQALRDFFPRWIEQIQGLLGPTTSLSDLSES